MNLIIDTGNTFTKLALFQGSEMVAFLSFKGVDEKQVVKFCESNLLINNAIVSSVKEYPSEIDTYLTEHYFTVLFSHTTAIPVKNKYSTPETLGKDRLAGVVGAQKIFPANDILVIDAGTAITYDFIDSQKNYLGGNIAPGIDLRLRSLHNFTDKLPLINFNDESPLLGNNTTSAINSGVLYGIIFEIDGYIDALKNKYAELSTFLTGGSNFYFATKLKNPIFAEKFLVLIGLNRILQYNA
jgi:type III pantothenate kinase